MKVRASNETTLPVRFAQRLAELAAEVAALSRRLRSLEDVRDGGTRTEQTSLTIHSYDDDADSIHFLTENGFVIVRPWETKPGAGPEGTFRFRVQDPDGIDSEVSIEISRQLLNETAARTGGRIEPSSQFWTCCAERRLANYLMEHDEFPPAKELIIETLDREDVLLAIRWGEYD